MCRGSIGRVKLAVHKETGFKVAIKIIDKEKITEVNPHLLPKIEREIVLMVCREFFLQERAIDCVNNILEQLFGFL